MLRRRSVLVLTGACLLLCADGAAGQTVSATTGTIEGTVTDTTGARLPGAAITAASDALMALRTTESAPDGSYRFFALPPGSYRLLFNLAGFETDTQDVRVSLGITTTVIATLKPAARLEVVTVEGGARVVDRRATMIATVFDARELAHLPGARTMGSILAATPAVQLTRFDVGGNAVAAPFSVYGTSGYNRPTIEGISVSGLNPYGFALDYGTFDNVSVGTGAYGPEWPSPGLHLQFTTKSGGNRHAGTMYAGYESEAWQSHNIADSQIDRGAPTAVGLPPREANRLRAYHDLNGDAGGYVIKDRLWWYASARDHAFSARQVVFSIQPIETRVTMVTAKGTWRPKDGHQLVVFAQGGRNRQPILLDAFLRTAATARNTSIESTSAQRAKGLVWKGEWNAVIGTRIFVEARIGQFVARRSEYPNGSSPRTEDRRTPEVSGGNRDWFKDWQSNQMNATVSYFRNGWGGRHQFKAGVQLERIIAGESWRQAYPGDALHVTENGIPSEVFLFQTPSRSESGVWWFAVHAGDFWQMNTRLTLNLGVRFDRFRNFLPAQQHPAGRFNPTPVSFAAVDSVAEWNVLAPRIGTSYDLLGDGRTVVKGSYGLYWLPPTTDLGFNVNPNGRVWWELFKWNDANGDGLWQRGEEFDLRDKRGGEAVESIDPDLKLAYVHEVTVRVEREAARDLFIGTSFVWRGERQQGVRQRTSWPFEAFSVARALRDPGPDAVFGTGDEGPDIQVFDLRPDLLGESRIVARNLQYTESDHLTWEVMVRRRFNRRWSFHASFAHAWNRDHANAYFGQPVRANVYPVTPNDFINTDEHGRHVYTNWSARASATWEGPWRIRITPFVRHQSGQAFGRTLLARLDYDTIRVLAEPVGTRRQEHVTLLDTQLAKDIRLADGRRLTGFAEVFNVLNANPEQNISWETGAFFLRPLVVVPPRIVRVGFRLHW